MGPMMGGVPRLASLIPTRFAQACATDGFVAACRASLTRLAEAPSAASAGAVLAGAAGESAAFLTVYAGAAIVQWKHDKANNGKKEHEAKARFDALLRAVARIEELIMAGAEIAQIDRELDELLKSDPATHARLASAEASGNSEVAAAVTEVVRDIYAELGIEESFEGVRIYLSNITDWVLDIRDTTREMVRKQDVQLDNQDEMLRLLRNLDQRQKSAGPQPPELTDDDKRILAEARAHGDAKAQAQAAIMQRDFAAADPLIEVVAQRAATELFDALTLRGDRHYYAGEFDAAVEPYEKALELRPNDITARNNVAIAHTDARLGNTDEHRLRAIEICTGTLGLLEETSYYWAATQNNLGAAYMSRPKGVRADNINKAISAYKAALTVHTREDYPSEWATAQNNMGNAYAQLPAGDRAENLHKAISAFKAVLMDHTRESHPLEWAVTQNNLGIAYKNLPTGDREENRKRAISAFEAALTVRTREAYPAQWALTQINLGNAYTELTTGERAENLKRAISKYESALTVYTCEAYPEAWAKAQYNLAIALSKLAEHTGQDGCRLLARAIASIKGALSVRTAVASPHELEATIDKLELYRRAYEAAGCSPSFDEIEPAS